MQPFWSQSSRASCVQVSIGAMSRAVKLIKGKNNMVGISIGGGGPLCPVLYVVQVFHRTPAYEDGSLCPGDELVAVNGVSLRGYTRKETADVIQSSHGEITISFNRIEPPKGKNTDISLKKVKHRLVEKMNDQTADSLGLSRAVLVNDKLVKKVENLEKNAKVYRGIAERARNFLMSIKALAQVHKEFGQVFCSIGVYERQKSASVAFTNFGMAHKTIHDEGRKFIGTVGPMLQDLHTFLEKAVPDTKLTLKKYSDAKFEFLAYCLKVKEMDDEEYEAAGMAQPLGRVMGGNYEYRMFLRCRHAAKQRFIKLRSDVLVKLQLLDNKRVQDVAFQLERLVAGMYVYYRQCHRALKPAAIFPIEVELLGDAAMASVLPPSLSDPTEVKEGDVMILQPHDESVGEELGSPGLGKDCQTGNLLDLVSPLQGGGGRGGGGGGRYIGGHNTTSCSRQY